MKRFLRSEDGSMGPLEGFMLAVFVVALVVGIRYVFYEPKAKSQPVANHREEWPELPPYEPIQSTNPLRR